MLSGSNGHNTPWQGLLPRVYCDPMKHNKHLRHEVAVAARSLATSTNSNQTEVNFQSSQDEVARRAYLIYLQQGSPQGQDLQHWFAAEAQTINASQTDRNEI